MRVVRISVLQDNYAYLLINTRLNQAALVDPAPLVPAEILAAIAREKVDLVAILATHHHDDHTAGVAAVVNAHVGLSVFGTDDRIPNITHRIKNDPFEVCGFKITPLFTPCHTTGHVCFYVEDEGVRAVFTGDTLFSGGCGRFFEGNAEEMHKNLVHTLGSLADDTLVYFGHEYTLNNLKFAETVDKDNVDIQAYKQKLMGMLDKVNSSPSTIGHEKKINLFMRVEEANVQRLLGVNNGVEAMRRLREMKDAF